MPEITALRLVLAIAELSVAVLVVRRDAGRLWGWAAYCYWAGASDLIPPLVGNPAWWRYLWSPVQVGLAALLAWAVVDAYGFTLPYLREQERSGMACFGALLGSVMVLPLAETWGPENGFQVFTRAREFGALALAVGHSAAWFWVRCKKPVDASPLVRRHGLLLAAWLWTYWIAATSAKNGTLWLLFTWKDGENIWRVHNAACLAVEILLMAGWAWMLRRERSNAA
jgi:hypothetical protein